MDVDGLKEIKAPSSIETDVKGAFCNLSQFNYKCFGIQ